MKKTLFLISMGFVLIEIFSAKLFYNQGVQKGINITLNTVIKITEKQAKISQKSKIIYITKKDTLVYILSSKTLSK